MKRNLLYLIAAATVIMVAATACKKDEAGNRRKITLSKEFTIIPVGGSEALIATVQPDVSSTVMVWTSSDPSVAVVDKNGNVSGVSAGKATINVTTDKGYGWANCEVIIAVESTITMTTAKSSVQFSSLYFFKEITIDWGDGAINTYDEPISIALVGVPNTGLSIEHSYPDSSPRTITITGYNISGLYCSGNELTNLDVSNAPMLALLNCSYNYMDASALNALFGTLHSNNITPPHYLDLIFLGPDLHFLLPAKSIWIGNNGPDCDGSGTRNSNPTIAEEKGWEVFL